MILEGCGAGPWMIRLIRGYWRDAIMVCRASGNCGTPFKAGRGVTQAIFDFSCGDLPHKKAGCFPRKEHSTSSQLRQTEDPHLRDPDSQNYCNEGGNVCRCRVEILRLLYVYH